MAQARKKCQLVQMNWKPSTASWALMNEDAIKKLVDESRDFFADKYGHEIYKKTSSFHQLIQQAEIDVLGASHTGEHYNYVSKNDTAMRIAKKIFGSAMCIYGYFNYARGEIIFAFPKTYSNVLAIVTPQIEHIEEIFSLFPKYIKKSVGT